MPQARGGKRGRSPGPQAGRAHHRPLRRRHRHHHPEPSMTASSLRGPSDPTVQPVPASVVEQVDAADTTLSNP
ncbi:2-amino-4-hydroxy-6-hydroxymethyldihydropteridine diphosphokinase, partial [Streptomyces sp. NPDC059627]